MLECADCGCELADEFIIAIHLAARHRVKMKYQEFLASKEISSHTDGIKPKPPHKLLFDFQKDIVKWALRRGRAAIFADCGLGKTLMQLEWARQIPGRVLILAPLAVSQQTVREGQKIGVDVEYVRKTGKSRISITNYQMLEHFNPADYDGIVLDESSILKSFEGKFRTQVIESFKSCPYRLACTATPAPNDFMELGNHSEFLGLLTRTEMLSTFFVHDMDNTQSWRLKGHAEAEFWKWVCSWAVMLRKPSDLGYDDREFILPPCEFHSEIVECEVSTDGFLFAMEAQTLQERQQARASTTEARCEMVAEIVSRHPNEQWLIWCNLNNESSTVAKLIPGAVELVGSDSHEKKESTMLGFSAGDVRVLITKPSIAGFGMNWQNCRNVVFLGLSDSYEQFYQAVRRCWRFGQKSKVNCHIVTSSQEGAVVNNIKRKEQDAARMAEEMVKHMHDLNEKNLRGTVRETVPYVENKETGKMFELYLGDCVEITKRMDTGSVHYSIYSPPFASLYTYSASDRDMGNCRSHAEFYDHFRFLADELLRILMPGRLMSFHCMNLPTSKSRDGYIGISDFRGDLIRIFQDAGFIYHSEVVIWKDPVTAMQRTKALGLLHKQIKKDSCMSRQGIPDYLVTMRKAGENPERVSHTADDFPVSLWQRYASPVWMDINPSDTLQKESAREDKDEKHIAPLQLEVIARALKLWTNPGDIVFSPFAGIGSEGYEALKSGRRFVGCELKHSYWKQAAANLHAAEKQNAGLFATAGD